jgi:aspartyl-tRNA(Asn)/glutamyl-tRNA(Gln) amidotransferase subunit A
MAIAELDTIPKINALGGFAAAESYAWHRDLLERRAGDYDPQVRVRIERGKGQSAADYIALMHARKAFIAGVEKRIGDFDAMAMPTVPVVPPRIDDLRQDDAFAATNLLLLRNPSVVNLLDGCAISLPVHAKGDAPVGLMLAAARERDAHLLRVARGVESIL